MQKQIILCFIKHYLPGYKFGGPVRSIANMIARMGDEFDFKIFSLDCDYTDNCPYPDITPNEWNPVGKAQVYYCSRSAMTFRFLRAFLTDTTHDVLYVNSFFDPLFTIKPLSLRLFKFIPDRPVVLAPRGEFSLGAFNIKAYKKKPFLWAARMLGLYRNITWQASTEYEATDVGMAMGGVAKNVLTAVDLSPTPTAVGGADACKWPVKSPDCLRVVFLSRISRKKNLDFALAVLKHVRISVCFDIYGNLEHTPLWQVCCDIIKQLPNNIRVVYQGEILHEHVHDVLHNYDLFFFPTRGENYGHVIMEALTAGLPVLISDHTPWRDLVAKGVGWDLPLDNPHGFAERITEVALMGVAKHLTMRNRAFVFAQDICNNNAAVAANRALFNSAAPTER